MEKILKTKITTILIYGRPITREILYLSNNTTRTRKVFPPTLEELAEHGRRLQKLKTTV